MIDDSIRAMLRELSRGANRILIIDINRKVGGGATRCFEISHGCFHLFSLLIVIFPLLYPIDLNLYVTAQKVVSLRRIELYKRLL